MAADSDRFIVVYDIVAADDTDAREKVLAICLEQTVELPEALVWPSRSCSPRFWMSFDSVNEYSSCDR
jgi:hypothetical protein